MNTSVNANMLFTPWQLRGLAFGHGRFLKGIQKPNAVCHKLILLGAKGAQGSTAERSVIAGEKPVSNVQPYGIER